MKSLVEFVKRHQLSNIIFDLDEDIVIDCDNVVCEFYGHRVIWRSSNNDTLNIGDHAKSREHRSVEDGGDGNPIKESEIINIFKYVWGVLMKMRYEGKLNTIYDEKSQKNVRSFTIQCQAKIIKKDKKVKYDCPRDDNQTLWIVFLVEDKADYKSDIYIKTIYRGKDFRHSKAQERIKITKNGKIEEIYNQ